MSEIPDLGQEYWDSRYESSQTGWDIGYPSTPLVEYFDQLKDKSIKILVPGAGNAYEVEYLHNKGFSNVYLLDFSPKALENFKNRVPDFPEDHLILSDFFKHIGQYDLIIEQTFFCALNPDLRPEYGWHVNSLLKEGGKLVGLLFQIPLYTEHPPFGGDKAEYINYFRPYFDFKVLETAYNSIKPREGNELFINMVKN